MCTIFVKQEISPKSIQLIPLPLTYTKGLVIVTLMTHCFLNRYRYIVFNYLCKVYCDMSIIWSIDIDIKYSKYFCVISHDTAIDWRLIFVHLFRAKPTRVFSKEIKWNFVSNPNISFRIFFYHEVIWPNHWILNPFGKQ